MWLNCFRWMKLRSKSGLNKMDSLKVSTNTSPLMTQLRHNTPYIKSMILQKAGCDITDTPVPTSSSSPSNSNTPAPNSLDRPDNHDIAFQPDGNGMEKEEERLKSFDKWPLPFLSPNQLAKNGFYYLGRGDEVRCAFCKVEIMRWLEHDDPAEEHKRWAPQCPLLRRNITGGSVFSENRNNAGYDECGARPSTSSVRMPGPMHPTYASEAARLASFKDWPRCMRQKPEELAEAGFFYTGNGDKTKCFYCDGGLKDWENDDVAWEQHARWFDRCAYVQLIKGREYVEKVLADAGAAAAAPKQEKNETTAPAPSMSVNNADEKLNDEKIDDEKLCKICYIAERNVCFVPCGHVVACAKCALSTNKCPMCRRTYQNAVRIYFS